MSTAGVHDLSASLVLLLLPLLFPGCFAQNSENSQVQMPKGEFLIALPIHTTKSNDPSTIDDAEFQSLPSRRSGISRQITRPPIKNGPTYPIKNEMNIFVKPLDPMEASKTFPRLSPNFPPQKKGRDEHREGRRNTNRYQPDGFFPPKFPLRQSSPPFGTKDELRRRNSYPSKNNLFKHPEESWFPPNFIKEPKFKLGPQNPRTPFRRRSLDSSRREPPWSKMRSVASREFKSLESSGGVSAQLPTYILPFTSSLEESLERAAQGSQEHPRQSGEGPSSSLYAYAPYPPYPVYDFSSVIYQTYPPMTPFYFPPYIYSPYFYPPPFYPVFPPFPWPLDFVPTSHPTFHVVVHPDSLMAVPRPRPDPIKGSDSSLDEVVMIEVPFSTVPDAAESRGFFHHTF